MAYKSFYIPLTGVKVALGPFPFVPRQIALINQTVGPGSLLVMDDTGETYSAAPLTVAKWGINPTVQLTAWVSQSQPSGALKVIISDEPGETVDTAQLQELGVSLANLKWSKNGVLVGTEPAADFIDANGVTWTLTDDLPNLQMKIAATVAPVAGAAAAANPADPAKIATTTQTMFGLGSSCQITPSTTGKVMAEFAFALNGGGFGDVINVAGRFGTGAPPANGAASAGGGFTATVSASDTTLNLATPGFITGMALGTTYWFDLVGFYNPFGAINSGGPFQIAFKAWEL